MKKIPFLLLSVLILAACRRKDNSNPVVYPIDAGLKANFGYKSGSYWIYKDSVTGAIDSAYVYANQINNYYHGCLLSNNQPKFETMTISIQVNNGNALDTERWNFILDQNRFDVNLYRINDEAESNLSFNLFTWPMDTGICPKTSCIMSPDYGLISEIIPVASVSNQDYNDLARSSHQYTDITNQLTYNDCFYVNKDAGLVKLVFDHPRQSVHRVMELQRYKIVK